MLEFGSSLEDGSKAIRLASSVVCLSSNRFLQRHAFVKLAFVVNSPMSFIFHQIWQQSNRAGLHMSAEKAGSSGSEAETKCVYMLGLDGTG